MSFIGDIFSGGAKGLMEGAGTLAKDIRSAITGEISPEKKAEIEQKLLELEFAAQSAQTVINLEEAKHASIFVSGWRPFIGWVCGAGICYQFILHPILLWAVSVAVSYGLEPVTPPVLDTESLMGLVFGMLGMGGLRTFEKIKGAARK
ncbi:MAG: 3TM-type holin [Thermodesulfovibrionales bacterium]|nr:3TM-type holin [Thermodesulfovibrionales bacterium]